MKIWNLAAVAGLALAAAWSPGLAVPRTISVVLVVGEVTFTRGTAGGIGTNGRRTFAYLEEGTMALIAKGAGGEVILEKLDVAVQGEAGFHVARAADLEALRDKAARAASHLRDKPGTSPDSLSADSAASDTALPAPGASDSAADFPLPPDPSRGGTALDTSLPALADSSGGELFLTIGSPGNLQDVTASAIRVSGTASPGATVRVFEATTRADAQGRWGATIQAPSREGEYNLRATASLGKEVRTREILIRRVLSGEPLRGMVHPVPAKISSPQMTLSGVCNDGARIEAGHFFTVATGGTWTLDVSWPAADEGTIHFNVYCLYNGEEAAIGEVETEYAKSPVPLALTLATPQSVKPSTAELRIRGSVEGVDPRVEVNGVGVPLVNGVFDQRIAINERNWDLREIEVTASDAKGGETSQSIDVEVDKTSRRINTAKPQFAGPPRVINGEAIGFGLRDSPGDEVEVFVSVDGDEVERMTFEGSLTLQTVPLAAGVHDYRIEARDLAGNSARWEAASLPYWPRVDDWFIEVVSPPSDRLAHLIRPTQDVAIRVRSLPDDDYRYLREVRIRNEANRAQRIWRGIAIDDVEFEFRGMPLVRGGLNRILVRVEPQRGPPRTVTRTLDLR